MSVRAFIARHWRSVATLLVLVVGTLILTSGGSNLYSLEASPLVGSQSSTVQVIQRGGNTGNAPADTPTNTPVPACSGAFHYLTPQNPAWCNGCTINTGDRFVLDMMINTGNYSVGAQDAYLSFDAGLVQNINVLQPGCIVTSTITPDSTVFEGGALNEVCNSLVPCTFGHTQPPGSITFDWGLISNPPYSGPDFRIAQLGFCATAPGTLSIHWEFTTTRYTDILNSVPGPPVNDPICYEDYTINIVGNPLTPTPTSTGGT